MPLKEAESPPSGFCGSLARVPARVRCWRVVWILVAVVSVWLVHRGLARRKAEGLLGRPLDALAATTLLVRIGAEDRAAFERIGGARAVEEPDFGATLLGRLAALEAVEERWTALQVGRGHVTSDAGARAHADAWIDGVSAALEAPERYRDGPASGHLVLAITVVSAPVAVADARSALRQLKTEALRSATRFRCVVVPVRGALSEAALAAALPRLPTI